MNYLGDFPTGATVYVYFDTFNSSGASVTLTGLGVTDIEIYKNGSVTQRSSDAGYTLLDTDGIDFDGQTGLHGFSIDTNDNTDAGFYAAGNEYTVWVSAVTVDSQTVSFLAASFSIERSGGALALLKHATFGLSAIETLVDDLESRLTATRAGYLDNLSGGAVALEATAQSILTDTAEIGVAGAGLTEAGGTGDHLTAINLPDQTMNITGNFTGNLSGSVGSVTGAVGSVTGSVGGNVAGSVGSVATGGISSGSFAAGAIDAASIASDTGNEIADALLGRNVNGGSSTGRLVKHAFFRLVNRVRIAAGTLTVYSTDDSTSAFTQTVTTTAGDPVSEVDTD